MTAKRRAHDERQPASGYETEDVSPRLVGWAALALLALLAMSIIAVASYVEWIRPSRPIRFSSTAPTDEMRTPQLQVSPRGERAEIESKAHKLLEEYRWTDPPGGHARIPIERAMEIVGTSGWPDDDEARR